MKHCRRRPGVVTVLSGDPPRPLSTSDRTRANRNPRVREASGKETPASIVISSSNPDCRHVRQYLGYVQPGASFEHPCNRVRRNPGSAGALYLSLINPAEIQGLMMHLAIGIASRISQLAFLGAWTNGLQAEYGAVDSGYSGYSMGLWWSRFQ